MRTRGREEEASTPTRRPIPARRDETAYWVCQDANPGAAGTSLALSYGHVLGVVDSAGALKERYEYTPYGQRTVFYDGPGAMHEVGREAVLPPQAAIRSLPLNQRYAHEAEGGVGEERGRGRHARGQWTVFFSAGW